MSTPADTAVFALIAHKIGPFQFDVGFGAVNASIRDQIVRAQMIVRGIAAIIPSEKYRSKERPLLICGAGIAGLAAATEADRLGLAFIMIDKHGFPSGALAGKGQRYVSPTMYEWPADGFDAHRHPPANGAFLDAEQDTGFPLNFTSPVTIEVVCDVLTNQVLPQLTDWKDYAAQEKPGPWYLPYTRIAPSTKDDLQALLESPTGDGATPTLPPILLNRPGVDQCVHVDWIIFAGGFAAEETTYAGKDFKTPPFWSQDDLAQAHFGMEDVPRVSAFIAGAGDGAIQDALRCLVCEAVPEPIMIWKALLPDPAPHGVDALLNKILSLEQYCSTAFMWSGRKEVFESIDAAHADLARKLLKLVPDIAKKLSGILRCDVERVHIQRNRAYFTRCYPLNRFLIHLVKTVLDGGAGVPDLSSRLCPQLTFGQGEVASADLSPGATPGSHVWKGHTYHRVVVRTGANNKGHAYQTIGLTGINPARTHFGRIPPPFVPAKK